MSSGQRLRQAMAERGLAQVMAAHSPLSARLAEEAGFDGVWASGFELSALYGLADVSLISMTQHLEMTRAIAGQCALPIVADLDTGSGNVINVVHTVREYERAGVAGIQLEDQVFPKRCGHMEGKDVIAPELHEQKLRAALDARRSGDTLIVARTDAIAVTGLEDAIARAKRYAAAGADVIFVDAPRSEDELRAIGSAGIGKPLLVNISEYGRTPDLGAAAFEQLGFSIALYPTSTLFAASQSTKELAASLRETGSTRGIVPRMMPFDELNETLGKDEWDVIP